MALSSDLMSLFVKTTKDNSKPKTESTAYGTVIKQGDETWVQLDGSDLLTPFTTTADVKDGERVIITIKNHTATVTGNTEKPAGRHEDIVNVGDKVDKLNVDYINTKEVVADKVDADLVVADEAILNKLKSDEIDVLSLIANKAVIQELIAENANLNTLEAKNAYLKFVTIDSVNVNQAWMDEFYAKSGLIEFITADDATVTGHLVGVTITGDMIKAGTLMADKLVVRGDDGNYYKINTDFSAIPGVEPVEEDTIHGSVMVANSITAEKISVSDLVAFNAKIAGFNLTQDAIYSGAKASVDSNNPGIYLDNYGQIHFGDRNNFIKFYKVVDPETGENILDADGNPVYKLAIAADTVMFGGNDVADLKALTDHVKIGKYEGQACVELAEGDVDGDGISDFKQVITSTKTMFMNNADVKTQIDHEGVKTDNLVVNEEFSQGNFVWATRANGNYGLIWKEVGN